MAVFTLTSGIDNFTGNAGEDNDFLFTPSTLQSSDTVTGAATGSFIDILFLTTPGSIAASQFAGVSNIEALDLPDGTNSVVLTNGLVAGTSLGQFHVAGGNGADTIDGSAISDGTVLVLAGSGGNDLLKGGNGNDIIDGGSGIDTMVGGAGNDTYHVDNEADAIVEKPGGGIDTVYSTVNYTLPSEVEILFLVEGAPAARNAAGNDSQNFIYGNSGDNVLSGGIGDDVLVGGAGNDILDGGPGNDAMAGGTGDDTYYVDSQADSVIENPDEGHDTVYASVDFTLPANVESLFLIEGTAAVNGAGNGLQNFIYGNSGNNVLSGYAGDDVLVGGVGNDVLDGGAGNDAMAGGIGDDTYIVDSEADTVIENPSEGNDTVEASVNYTLPANVENLIMLPGALNGAGNSLANVIIGNSAANNISGNGGADVLLGGDGDDKIYIPDSAFASIDGGTGFNWLVLTSARESLDLHANAAKISNIEVISLSSASAATLSLTNTDIAQVNASGNFLYVIGDPDDTVTVGDTWTLVTNSATNANLPGITFVQYHNTTTGSDLFIADTIAPSIATDLDNPPTIFLDGVPDLLQLPDGLDHSASYITGNAAGVAIADVDASVNDPDFGDKIVSLDATITDPHSGAAEFLELTAAGHAIATANGLSIAGEDTASLQVTGAATDTVYQDLLREIRYVNTDIGPGLDTADRHITVVAQDQHSAASNTPVATIALTRGGPPQLANPDALIVAAGAPAVSLGILAPTDPNISASLVITVTTLPNAGTVQYFDGSGFVPITAPGTTLTAAELASVEYVAPAGGIHDAGTFAYSVSDGVVTEVGSEAISVVAPVLVFSATTPTVGTDLFQFDGLGNWSSFDIHPGPNNSYAGEHGGFAQFGDDLYFMAAVPQPGDPTFTADGLVKMDPAGVVTAVSDGTFLGQVHVLADTGATNANFFDFDGHLFLMAGTINAADDIVRIDADGSVHPLGINPFGPDQFNNTFPQNPGFVAFDQHLYFTAFTAATGIDLFRLDTATSATPTAIDVIPGASSSFAGEFGGFAVFNDNLYFHGFSAADGGDVLFSLAAGSSTATEVLDGGSPLFNFFQFNAFHVASDGLFFTDTDLNGPFSGDALYKLDAGNGVTAITFNGDALTGAGQFGGFAEFNDALYFTAAPASTGVTSLFKVADGSTTATEVDPALENGFDANLASGFAVFDGHLYFDARAAGGDALFALDSNDHLSVALDSGTTQAGVDGGFQDFAGNLYFSAYTSDGYELVKLAPGGALTSYDINPGPAANGIPGDPGGFAVYPGGGPVLVGTPGNDVLAGSAAHDTFVFAPGFGHDQVVGFTPGADVIAIDHSLFVDFADISSPAHMQQVGLDTMITFNPANTITLHNVTASNLHAGDFLFF